MSATSILCVVSGLLSCGFGLAAVLDGRRSLVRWAYMAGMASLGLESILGALALQVPRVENGAYWQAMRMVAGSFLPGSWLLFSITYSRGDAQRWLRKWWSLVLLFCAAPILAFWGVRGGLVTHGRLSNGQLVFGLGAIGFGLSLLLLISSALVLANLEQTFRASIGTMRWRLKFRVLGLGLIFGVRIYTSSQALLYSEINRSMQALDAAALAIGCFLMGWSLLRADLLDVEVFPSGTVLQKSITFGLTGAYLFVVGALAKLVSMLGGYLDFPIGALLVLLALVGLSLLLLSDRLRHRLRRFISRHFRRPVHNYRQVWARFAEETGSLLDETDLCRRIVKLVSETFQVLSVTLWRVDDNEQLAFSASTSLRGKQVPSVRLDSKHFDLAGFLRQHPIPLILDGHSEAWADAWNSANPSPFDTKPSICLPLVAQNELLGVLYLSDRVSDAPFLEEDKELLKCIGVQVSASLLNLELSKKLIRARELEAFQTMSTFFVHDLKNTANSLSLLLQNLSAHFHDPAFREDAQRAVSNSVQHLTSLIGRLALLRQRLDVHPVEIDLNTIVGATLADLHLPTGETLSNHLQDLPPVRVDPEQIQKVVTNLVLNAREAGDGKWPVEISTSRVNGWAVLSVQDHGCGMSPEFLNNSLFRPFQTTKKTGLGIGMFHSKMIVDAHRGRIEVDSEPGKGTTVRVLLPIESQSREN
jgi:putative PEP-CTERM system histidine kinase